MSFSFCFLADPKKSVSDSIEGLMVADFKSEAFTIMAALHNKNGGGEKVHCLIHLLNQPVTDADTAGLRSTAF